MDDYDIEQEIADSGIEDVDGLTQKAKGQAKSFQKKATNKAKKNIQQKAKKSAEKTAKQTAKAAKKAAAKGSKAAVKGAQAASKATVKAGKAAAHLVGKASAALAKGISALIAATGPVGIVIIAVVLVLIILLGAGYVFLIEERGSNESNTLEIGVENPTYIDPDTHVSTAIAMTEPQAVIDAYYKMLSSSSYVKQYKDKSYEFDDKSETSDFAALRDYYQIERNFYLSDDFIRSVDELLHENTIYYPEQIIKPVFGKILTLKDKNNNETDCYTALLPYDTSDGEKMLDDETVKGFSEMLAGTFENGSTVADEPELRATSTAPSELDENGQVSLEERDVLTDTEGDVAGLWDYGFGSVLQYQPEEKQSYIVCQYDSVDVDVHYEQCEIVGYDEETGAPIYGWVDYCAGAWPFAINTTSAIEFMDYCRDYVSAADTDTCHWYIRSFPVNLTAIIEGTAWDVAAEPNAEAEKEYDLVYDRDLVNSHIDMKIENSWDNDIDHLDFGEELKDDYENKGGGLYPLKIAVVNHASTFSGNIHYTITPSGEEGCIRSETALLPNDTPTNDLREPVQTVNVAGGCGSGKCGTLTAHRTGTAITMTPKVEETTSPWGFEYLQQYASHYRGYIPTDYVNDRDFFVRAGIKADEGTGDKLKYLENLTFLIDLGLLRRYSGSKIEYEPTEYVNADDAYVADTDLEILSRIIAAEGGASKLNQLMTGATFLNKVYAGETPAAFSDIAATYPCYSSGGYASAAVNDVHIASAIQVMSGEFAIPTNVVSQTTNEAEGTTYYSVTTTVGVYYYCTGNSEQYTTVDRWGRPAPDPSQLNDLAQSLAWATAEDASQESASSTTSTQSSEYTTYDEFGNKINSSYALYEIEDFDVLEATNLQAELTTTTTGTIGKLLRLLGEVFESIADQISIFFDKTAEVFQSPVSIKYYPLQASYNAQDVRATVYHSIAFSNQVWFSTAQAAADEAAKSQSGLTFLFVGSDSRLALGSLGGVRMTRVPGVSTSVEGMISPTARYFQTAEAYSAAVGHVLLSTPQGTDILAVADGKIIQAVTSTTDHRGNYVVLEATINGATYQITTGYLDSINVVAGQTISQGDVVGTSGIHGGTGATYLAVMRDGVVVDPTSIFYQWEYSSSVGLAGDMNNPDGTVNQDKIAQLAEELETYALVTKGNEYYRLPINQLQYLQCTWWARGRGLEYLDYIGMLENEVSITEFCNACRGNGGEYANNNKTAGTFKWGYEPKVGALVCYPGSPGHIAFVEAVDYVNKEYYISHAGSGKYWLGISKMEFNASYRSYGAGVFIYIDELN